MALTFLDVKRLVAQYSNRGGGCIDSPETELYARQVMEYLMINGAYGSIRRFCFVAQKGCVTLPPELQTPLQVKIDGRVGTVWNQWMTMHSVACELEGCAPANEVLRVEPNPVYTAYAIPEGGSVLAVLGTCKEDPDAFLTVQSEDVTGRQIFTNFRGEDINGEKFQIVKGNLRYGEVMHAKITGITKSKTNGYVQLWAVNPNTKQQIFLGDYSPLEERPQYRQASIFGRKCGPNAHVEVQGRISLKEKYTDNDIVPFDSVNSIILGAQKCQAENNNNIQTAAYKDQALTKIIENDAAYRRVSPGTPINTFVSTAGGAIKNIVF